MNHSTPRTNRYVSIIYVIYAKGIETNLWLEDQHQ